MNRFTCSTMALLGMLLAARPALADTVEADHLPFNNVKIEKIEGNEIFFRTSSDNESHRAVNDSLRINIPSEPVLNAAESAYAAQQWSEAADNYKKVLDNAAKTWLKRYAAMRLQSASVKAGRFDTAVSAWIFLVGETPADASKFKPALPADKNAPAIKAAETQLERDATNATGETRQAMLNFELDLARYQDDKDLILHITQILAGGSGNTPATSLNLVQTYLEAKDYASAKKLLDTLKAGMLGDAGLENQRLFYLAEIAYNTAAANAAPSVYQDLALDFMRVVANDNTGPLVARALLRVAQCQEKSKDPAGALQTYRQISVNYANAPEQKAYVTQALQDIHRLEGN